MGRVLDDFGAFWRTEEDADAKCQLLCFIFQRVWLDDGRIVAVDGDAVRCSTRLNGAIA